MEIMSASFPLLTLLVAVPAIGALALWIFKPLQAQARVFSLLISTFVLLGSVYLAVNFDYSKAGNYQWSETYAWIPSLGVSWALGVNALGLAMLILSAFLVLIVLIASARLVKDPVASAEDSDTVFTEYDSAGYLALTLASLAFMVLIFTARDVFLFYLTFEAMLIPVYFLIGRYGNGADRQKAAMKFLLYSLAGGLVMLIGVVALWVYSPVRYTAKGAELFLIENLQGILNANPQVELWVFISFFIAFAVKAPMVPVHTWLADVAENARPGTSALLVGILDKIGTFGMIVFCLPIFPNASKQAATVIIILAVISVIWGAFAALAQQDLLRLISFTSVSHFGLMVMGIFVGNTLALTGAMFYMVAHGLSIAGLFLVGGFLTERAQTQKIADFGGMQRTTPILAASFFICGLAAIALPGLSGFVPELMVFIGTFKVVRWAAVLSLVGVVIGAVYILLPYQRIFTGAENPKRKSLADLDQRERWGVVAPLIALMLILGLAPQPLVQPLNQVSETVSVAQSASIATVEGSNR